MTDKEKFFNQVWFKVYHEHMRLQYVPDICSLGGISAAEGVFVANIGNITDLGFDYFFYQFGNMHSGTCLFSHLKFES